MADPNYPLVTSADVRQSRIDQGVAVLQGLGFAAGLASVYSYLNAPGGRAGRFAVKTATGVEVLPSSTGRGSIRVPLISLPVLLAPSPIGLVPAEVYGKDPDTVMKFLGIRAGSKPPILNASDARVKVYAARSAAQQIMSKATGVTIRSQSGVILGYDLAPGPIPITRGELSYLESLPSGVHPDLSKFLAATAGRLEDFIPDSGGPAQVVAPIEGHLLITEDDAGRRGEAIEGPGGVLVPIGPGGVPLPLP